jgi:predicted transglutaminase-like cysteine proteinase
VKRKPLFLPALAIFFLSSFIALALDYPKLQDSFVKKYTSASLTLFNAWQNIMMTSSELKSEDKTTRINDSSNRNITWQEDQKIWGASDYWATPFETIAKKAGDCEDFAIIKYFSLIHLGIPVNQLRLVYVKAKNGNGTSSSELAHMVLAYYPSPDSEPFILDNMLSDIRPASRRPDLVPVFSFNSEGVYNGVAENSQQSGGIERLSKWQDLLHRAKNEGLN